MTAQRVSKSRVIAIAVAVAIGAAFCFTSSRESRAAGQFSLILDTTCPEVYVYQRTTDGPDNVSWFIHSWSYLGRVRAGRPLAISVGPMEAVIGSFSGYASHSKPAGDLLEQKRIRITRDQYESGGYLAVKFEDCR